eukprot:653898-Amphidinium_carterae.1
MVPPVVAICIGTADSCPASRFSRKCLRLSTTSARMYQAVESTSAHSLKLYFPTFGASQTFRLGPPETPTKK